MTINKDSEAVRQLNVESAYFYTETGNPGDSLSGPEAAAIKMTNDEGQRCTLAHHHSGITRFETEGEMLIIAGEKTPSGNSDFILVTNSGDVDVVAEDGNVRIRADNNITLEADNIVIKDYFKKNPNYLEKIKQNALPFGISRTIISSENSDFGPSFFGDDKLFFSSSLFELVALGADFALNECWRCKSVSNGVVTKRDTSKFQYSD